MGMGRCGDKRKTETPVKRVWMAGRGRMAHGLCPCFLVVYDATCMPLCKPTVAAYLCTCIVLRHCVRSRATHALETLYNGDYNADACPSWSILRLLHQLGNTRYMPPPRHFVHLISTTTYVSPPMQDETPVPSLPSLLPPHSSNRPARSICPSSSRVLSAICDMGACGMPRCRRGTRLVSSSGLVRETATPTIPRTGVQLGADLFPESWTDLTLFYSVCFGERVCDAFGGLRAVAFAFFRSA